MLMLLGRGVNAAREKAKYPKVKKCSQLSYCNCSASISKLEVDMVIFVDFLLIQANSRGAKKFF